MRVLKKDIVARRLFLFFLVHYRPPTLAPRKIALMRQRQHKNVEQKVNCWRDKDITNFNNTGKSDTQHGNNRRQKLRQNGDAEKVITSEVKIHFLFCIILSILSEWRNYTPRVPLPLLDTFPK